MAELKEERGCPFCLRPVILYGAEERCPRCREIVLHPEGRWEDIEFMAAALMRHVRKSLGYWPPRWARRPPQNKA
jgi:hypothetical protein